MFHWFFIELLVDAFDLYYNNTRHVHTSHNTNNKSISTPTFFKYIYEYSGVIGKYTFAVRV